MSDGNHWFKLHASVLDDPDMSSLSNSDWAVWAKFGTWVKQHGEGGKITFSARNPLLLAMMGCKTDEDLISSLKHVKNITIENDISVNEKITVTFLNWHKYQTDNSLKRVQRWRERTCCNDQEKRREEKKREENIKENKTKEKNPGNSCFSSSMLVALPYSSPLFIKSWEEWKQYKNGKMTKLTCKKQLEFLSKLGEERAIKSINQSIQNGWKGLFEPKGENNGKSDGSPARIRSGEYTKEFFAKRTVVCGEGNVKTEAWKPADNGG